MFKFAIIKMKLILILVTINAVLVGNVHHKKF